MNKQLKPKPVRAIASQEFSAVVGTGAVTESAAIDAAKNKEVISTASAESEQKPLEPTEQIVTLSASQLETMLKTAIASVTDDVTKKVEGKFETDIKTLQTELDQAKADLADAQNQKAAIANVFTALGHSHPVMDKSSALGVPAVNRLIESTSDRIDGRFKEWRDRIDKAESKVWRDPASGVVYTQRDWKLADKYWIDNRASLRDELEAHFKANGFLKGVAAGTIRTDLLPTLLDALSTYIRLTHTSTYIFWQFVYRDIKMGVGRGDAVQVRRVRNLPESTTTSDTLLPITGPSTSRQNLFVGSARGQLERRGLNTPVLIPEFFSLYSLIDLEVEVGSKLGLHYQSDIDLRVRTQFFATTRVLYNDGGSVTAVASDVGLGDDGSLTESFLNAVRAYLGNTLKIATDEKGCYWLAAPSLALVPLLNSLAAARVPMTVLSLQELTNLFTVATKSDMPTISGYVGTYCKFHIFESTAFGGGLAGTEGVQNETLGVGSTLTRTCFAGGFYAVAHSIALPAEIRRATEDNFGTQDSWTWISDDLILATDLDSAIDSEQQTRVVELRVTDRPV